MDSGLAQAVRKVILEAQKNNLRIVTLASPNLGINDVARCYGVELISYKMQQIREDLKGSDYELVRKNRIKKS